MQTVLRIAAVFVLSAFSSQGLADVASDISSVPDYSTEKTDKNWSGMIGAAAMSKPEYIGSEDSETAGLPIIMVDYKDTAYFKVNRAGVWFWKPSDQFRVGALVKIRPGAWEDDDDSIEDLGPLPAGFDEPDTQTEPGVNFLYTTGNFSFEVQLLSGEDTNIAANADYRLILSEKSNLTLRVASESLGEDTVNYNWYGDTSGADVDSATNTSFAVIGTYQMNPKWTLLYGVQTTFLDDEIDDSPIVEEDQYTVGFVGAGWNF